MFDTQPFPEKLKHDENETSMQLRGKEVNYLYQKFIAFTKQNYT